MCVWRLFEYVTLPHKDLGNTRHVMGDHAPCELETAMRAQDLQRGDIVIVPHPEIAGFELIKRVIGLPGETIGLSNGYVHINEIALAEPWANGPTRPDGEWTLGLDEVFVLGDSRQVSAADSRTIGPIDASTVRWRAVARYWPLQSAGRLPTRPFSP